VSERPFTIGVLGPTGAGKTRLAMQLAQALDSEIVSADSVQVYRGLDIGSAKPTRAEQAAVRHHALDLFAPAEETHAGRWLVAAEDACQGLHAQARVPILCGGTGLYVRALLLGLSAVPSIEPALRARVRAEVAADPLAAYARLLSLDPETAARVAPRDQLRVGRALEVADQTGRPLTAWHAADPQAPLRSATLIVLEPDAATLEARLVARAAAMLAGGLVDEVRELLASGLEPNAPGLSTLGYRTVVEHLTRPNPDLLGTLARAHRQYAKRQRTWFRGSGMRGLTTVTLDPDAPDALARAVALVAHPHR